MAIGLNHHLLSDIQKYVVRLKNFVRAQFSLPQRALLKLLTGDINPEEKWQSCKDRNLRRIKFTRKAYQEAGKQTGNSRKLNVMILTGRSADDLDTWAEVFNILSKPV